MAQAIPTPERANEGQKQGASGPDAPSPATLEQALQAGWRVEVDLTNRRWRYVRGSKRRRQWTPYYDIASVPGGAERIQRAQAESARQRAQRLRENYL